jgi:hypothetical protein
MKPEKFKKKLTLNKKTIVDLNSIGMKDAQGGLGSPPTNWVCTATCPDASCACPMDTPDCPITTIYGCTCNCF